MIRTTFASLKSIAFFVLILVVPAWSQGMGPGTVNPPANLRPPGLKNVGIEQRLNEQIPRDLAFRDQTGNRVLLGDYFGSKPMILNLVYYKCPMLCSEVLSGLTSALKPMKLDVGNDFEVLTVSFDPRETPQDATRNQRRVSEALRTSWRGTGLALSNWAAGVNRRADQGRWLPVPI